MMASNRYFEWTSRSLQFCCLLPLLTHRMRQFNERLCLGIRNLTARCYRASTA